MTDGSGVRSAWVRRLDRLLAPVLEPAASGELAARMAVERRPGHAEDGRPSALEAVARALAGAAPWLDGAGGDAVEISARTRLRGAAMGALARLPHDFPLDTGRNALVEAGFLAHALLRAPRLVADLPGSDRQHLANALASTRAHQPYRNNWLCFAAMAETGIAVLGGSIRAEPIAACLDQLSAWYVGDGWHSDGPGFHLDYYNSFVIHPMLLDLLAAVGDRRADWQAMVPVVRARARRHAVQLERMIAPDGSFPAVGRSLAYRCGAFQLLAQAALSGLLDGVLPSGQVRCALDAVIARTLDAPGTFRDDGYLAIGLCGAQADVAEPYISTGSLLLCTTAFLPLGLTPSHPFWTEPAQPWTGWRAWSGGHLDADQAHPG